MTAHALHHGSALSHVSCCGGERPSGVSGASQGGTGLGGNTLARIVEQNCPGMPVAAGVVIEHLDAQAGTWQLSTDEGQTWRAIRTDLILSAEIMTIALADVSDAPLATQAGVLIVVGLTLSTIIVVSSLGVGGTNAHAVLQEAPARAASGTSDWPFQPLVISAKSKAALDGQAARLAQHLRAHPEQPLADVAFTLKQGRRAFEKRRVLVAGNLRRDQPADERARHPGQYKHRLGHRRHLQHELGEGGLVRRVHGIQAGRRRVSQVSHRLDAHDRHEHHHYARQHAEDGSTHCSAPFG